MADKHSDRAKRWKREDNSRRQEAARVEENFGRSYSDQDSDDSLAEQFREVEREAKNETVLPGSLTAVSLTAIARAGDALRQTLLRVLYQADRGEDRGADAAVEAWNAVTRSIVR